MVLNYYQQLLRRLETESVVLATVVTIKGSVPREVGAKMMVWGNGKTFGTIGGGAGEAKVIQQALNILQTGENQFVEIDLSGASHRETQGICGGLMQVWLERWHGDRAIALTREILHQLHSGQPAILVTPFSQSAFPYLTDQHPNLSNWEAIIETIQPPPTLLIVGAGHVGVQLAKVADLLGFQVAIQDDRPEWANEQLYPQAWKILNESIGSAIAQLESHTQLYAALVTRGYRYDLEALEALLTRSRPCQYLGMIGSEKRVRQVIHMVEKTTISADQLNSIYAPIGLDIGALTPEEIAVSIGAELVLVRRGGTGRPLSEAMRQRSKSI